MKKYTKSNEIYYFLRAEILFLFKQDIEIANQQNDDIFL